MSKKTFKPNSIRCIFGLHDWGIWTQYVQNIKGKFGHGIENRQKRQCNRCNKMEDEYV